MTATRRWPRPTSTEWRKNSRLASSSGTTVKIENFPTPISRVVDENEAHFQLRRGRIAYVPFNEFAGKFRSLLEQKPTSCATRTKSPKLMARSSTLRPLHAGPGRSSLGRSGPVGSGGELHPTEGILFLSRCRRHRRTGRRRHEQDLDVSRQARRVQSLALHDYLLDLSRQLRRLQSRPQGLYPTGLFRRRPTDSRRTSHRRRAERQQVERPVFLAAGYSIGIRAIGVTPMDSEVDRTLCFPFISIPVRPSFDCGRLRAGPGSGSFTLCLPALATFDTNCLVVAAPASQEIMLIKVGFESLLYFRSPPP